MGDENLPFGDNPLNFIFFCDMILLKGGDKVDHSYQ